MAEELNKKVSVRWLGNYKIVMKTEGFLGEVKPNEIFKCNEDVYNNDFKSHKLYELVKEKKVKTEEK